MRTLVLATLLVASAAHAAPEPPARLMYSHITAVRYNPLGLQTAWTLQARKRLIAKEGVLWDPTHVAIGPTVSLTPASTRGGLQVQVMPIAMVQLRAAAEGAGYFGSFDQVRSFHTTDVDYSDRALSADGDAGRHQAATGVVWTLEGRLQAKVGPIAVRDTVTGVRFDLDLGDRGTVFYDPTFDVLQPNHGWSVKNDADLLYVHEDSGNTLGLRYTTTDPVHGDGSAADAPTHQAGLLFARKLGEERPGARFDAPTLFVLTQWWLAHPYRTGADVSQAVPYVAVGLGGTGDLWRKE